MSLPGSTPAPVLPAPIDVARPRALFISRTYTHLLGAVLAFTWIEARTATSPRLSSSSPRWR